MSGFRYPIFQRSKIGPTSYCTYMVGPIRQKVKGFFLQNDLFFSIFFSFFVEIAQKKQHFYKHTIFNPTILSHLYKYCFLFIC